MAWDPTLYTFVGVAAAGLFFVIAVAGWKHRSEPAAKAFLGLITALGGWALVYGIQLGFTTLDAQLAWQRVALTIGGPVPTLWFLFSLQYTNRNDWLTRPVRTLMVLDPVIFGVLTLTNPSHGLIWHGATLVTYGPLHAVDLAFGPGYYLHIAYTYVVTPTGFGLLLLSVARSTLYRTQAALLVVGSLPPLAANAAFSLGIDWAMAAVDFTPFAFLITGPCFGLALFRFDLLERVPVARKRIIAETDDGFVVLDEDERIVTANPAAGRILDGADAGQPIREQFPGADDAFDIDAVEGTTMTAVVDGQQRVYDVSRSTLSDSHGRVVGYILRFRNVTDRHTYEQRLKVANRVLRHNLRNRMNVIVGWANELRDHEDEDVATASQQITTTAEELIELGEQVRLLVETADYADQATDVVDLGTHLAPVVGQVREAYPEATVEAELPSGVEVVVPNRKLLTIAVRNLVENAIEHNDTDRPQVRVTLEPAADSADARLRVADNGPGIPEAELEVLRKGNETPLEHGSGLGLWLVHWTVTAAGGTVTFDQNEPRGGVVTLTFRAAD